MKWIFVAVINLYQTYVSPRKGFCCAHRQLHGGHSCSEAIKQLIIARGLFGSWRRIVGRFSACRSAAEALKSSSIKPLHADTDCGLSGCVGCADIGSIGGAEACFLGGGDVSAASDPIIRPVVFVPLGLTTLLIILACLYWFHGRQIALIEIRLVDGAQEVSDKKLAKLFNNQLPDYQIILDVNGETVKTNTLKNSSAADWLQLTPGAVTYTAEINRLTIVNKQILKDQILEEFLEPSDAGSGKYYRYRIRNNWELF